VLSIKTAEGTFVARYTGQGLRELDFPSQATTTDIPDRPITSDIFGWHQQTGLAVHAILHGKCIEEFPPLDISRGSLFQQRVWNALREIPRGAVKSYGELARLLGTPGGSRAIGMACGANPIPLLIPCHRVVAADGTMGGFSGGLDWKRKLLAREGVLIRERDDHPPLETRVTSIRD
jgi:methylated-DNA-[protein]-cysteine S-methyltransferase